MNFRSISVYELDTNKLIIVCPCLKNKRLLLKRINMLKLLLLTAFSMNKRAWIWEDTSYTLPASTHAHFSGRK